MKKRYATVGLFAAMCFVVATAGGVSAAGVGAEHSTVQADADVHSLAQRLHEYGMQNRAEVYGGLEIAPAEQVPIVYLTNVSEAEEQGFDEIADGSDIRFAHAPVTYANLMALHEQLAANWNRLSALGVPLRGFGPSIRDGLEHVTLTDSSAANRAAVQTTVTRPGGLVFDDTFSGPLPRLYSGRTGDSSPWNGGDSVLHRPEGGCTTGFGITLTGGGSRVITAGHCYKVGEAVYNTGYCSTSGVCPVPTSDQIVGKVTYSGVANDDLIDVESIPAQSTALFWAGSRSNPYPVFADGTEDNFAGMYACVEGSYTGQKCDIQVGRADYCDSYQTDDGSYLHLCSLVSARELDGGAPARYGDSGGPVFRGVNGKHMAVGSITGAGMSRGPDTVAWTGMHSILNYLNAHVNAQ